VTFPTTDFAAVAQAFGIRAHVVRSVGELGQIDDWAQRPRGPLLLDCRINRDVRAPFILGLRS
jgi:thiamine pyrophosphate-dependent acetolactate synthase large subunit-like protein